MFNKMLRTHSFTGNQSHTAESAWVCTHKADIFKSKDISQIIVIAPVTFIKRCVCGIYTDTVFYKFNQIVARIIIMVDLFHLAKNKRMMSYNKVCII